MARVIIIGGHGKIALRLARLLTARGDAVSSVIRNQAHRGDIIATGAVPVLADVEHLDTGAIAEVLAGADVVVWSAGAGGGDPERTFAVDRDAAIRSIDAARAAGVPRYIMVSYFGAGTDHGVPQGDSFFAYAEAKAAADRHLTSTDLSWTILGPSRLTDDPGSGRIEVGELDTSAGSGTSGSATSGSATSGSPTSKREVSRDNVAAVAAAVIADPATAKRVIEFNDGDVPIENALA
ncbi:NAD-dependent epimerase/dehydratase family protein [Gordonia oryzae]|uniref:NAD-dependent epimerase/dehydratase family protein n=1 Tax=Gordonia oryzae TaxID=2487349 RepID=A0A3N4GH61_9ACTN|nr:NAD(P)H-binding protein [Gordonia oryzae]RPA61078.1 NAD-dependent epimerase/dehydratase family protein [Gordonia oryzae]